MLAQLLDEAIERGTSWITLEVRESNTVAQNLYKKYGFTVVNTRRGYYSDNDENALVMWAGNLKGEIFRNRLAALKAGLGSRFRNSRRWIFGRCAARCASACRSRAIGTA